MKSPRAYTKILWNEVQKAEIIIENYWILAFHYIYVSPAFFL
jgi:hypothetical protein